MTLASFVRSNAKWLSAGVLLMFLSSPGQTFFISLFAGHIQTKFNLTHGQWGGIYSIATFLSAIAMVWAGALSDVFRARTLGPVVLLLLGLSCIAMATIPVWWALFAVIFALRFTGQGMSSHIALVCMSRWFVDARGRALAIATLGFAFGEALLPLVFVSLMSVFAWQTLWVFAAIMSFVGIPILLSLLRQERTPQSLAKHSHSTGMKGMNWTRRQTLSHWLFWLMVPPLLGPPAFGTAFFFYQVHYADIKMIDHVQLVALYPVYTLISVIAMIGSGWALDRVGTARLIPFMQIPAVLAFALLSTAQTTLGIAGGLMCFALTAGITSTLPAAFWAEFYGTAHLGAIKAMAAAVMVLGSALGPGLVGTMLDLGIGLERQYVWVAGYFVLTTLMMFLGVGKARSLLPLSA
ncbi:MAG: MFS transporter [Pseudomonadota bacterium]